METLDRVTLWLEEGIEWCEASDRLYDAGLLEDAMLIVCDVVLGLEDE